MLIPAPLLHFLTDTTPAVAPYSTGAALNPLNPKNILSLITFFLIIFYDWSPFSSSCHYKSGFMDKDEIIIYKVIGLIY